MEAPDEELITVRAAAEELYQEIWIRVIEARASYAPTARFSTWLYTIAHNRLVDHWRRRNVPLDALDEDLPAEAADPMQELEARQALSRFASALEKLPPAQLADFRRRHPDYRVPEAAFKPAK